jgi:uncharacterized repeat protein (TIGR03847 family)
MNLPEQIDLSKVDFITIDTIGPPGQRTFFLQAAQGTTVITMIIEKEHAAALSIAIQGVLNRLGGGRTDEEFDPSSLDLILPVEPLFRVGKLGLGYDQEHDMLVIMAEELAAEEDQPVTQVRIWADRVKMAALARKAAVTVSSGRPLCPLCGEAIEPDEVHVCTKGNGHKRIYEIDGD